MRIFIIVILTFFYSYSNCQVSLQLKNDSLLKSEELFEIGVNFFEMENFDSATVYFTKSLLYNPKDTLTLEKRAIVYRLTNKKKLAIDDYSKLIQLLPQKSFYYCLRGAVKSSLNDYTGSNLDFGKAIKLDSVCSSAYHLRGLNKMLCKDYIGAINDQSKAIKLDSTIAIYYYARGLQYSTMAINNLILNPKFNDEDNKKNYQHSCDDFSKAKELGMEGIENLILEVCK